MMGSMKRGLVAVLGAGLLAGLVACGGGGGDDAPPLSAAPSGPPAAAAAMGTTADDAISATKTALAVADGMAARKGALAGLSTALGLPVSGGTASPLALRSALPQANARMKRPLAVQDLTCSQFFEQACSGNVRTDTNIPETANRITRGQYLDGTFTAVSLVSFGEPVTLNGRLRAEFLTDFDLNAPSFSGFGLRLVLTGFSGTLSGAPFGPLSETMDLTIDGQGVPILVTAGARFGTLASVRLNGPGAYTIGTGIGRVAYGGVGPGYADVRLNGWNSRAGRPSAPSQADVSVPNLAGTVSVIAEDAGSVVYEVTLAGTTPGSARFWRVTALYPAGGGAPAYSAAPL